ncbi:MAG: hypothetical protein AAF418_03715 [Pseudomonadota bacterium]
MQQSPQFGPDPALTSAGAEQILIARYQPRMVIANALMAFAALTLMTAMMILLDLAAFIAWILAPAACLCAWYGIQNWLRLLVRIELDAQGVTVHGIRPRQLRWNSFTALALRYYPRPMSYKSGAQTRTRSGWFTLSMRGSDGRLVIDSDLEHFDQLLAHILKACATNKITMDHQSLHNLAACGHDLGQRANQKATHSSGAQLEIFHP